MQSLHRAHDRVRVQIPCLVRGLLREAGYPLSKPLNIYNVIQCGVIVRLRNAKSGARSAWCGVGLFGVVMLIGDVECLLRLPARLARFGGSMVWIM